MPHACQEFKPNYTVTCVAWHGSNNPVVQCHDIAVIILLHDIINIIIIVNSNQLMNA